MRITISAKGERVFFALPQCLFAQLLCAGWTLWFFSKQLMTHRGIQMKRQKFKNLLEHRICASPSICRPHIIQKETIRNERNWFCLK